MWVRVTFRRGSWEGQYAVEVPSGLAEPADLVPALHQLSDQIANSSDPSIACGPGCGACCRQLVPVTSPEIGFLQQLVQEMPASRRQSIERVSVAAAEALTTGGFGSPDELCAKDKAKRRHLAIKWFGLGIPCPFLVDESCSIHESRPLACREYLVTNPPQACSTPGRGSIERLFPPVSIWSRVARWPTGEPRWLPLAAALRAPMHQTAAETGPGLLSSLLTTRTQGKPQPESVTPAPRYRLMG